MPTVSPRAAKLLVRRRTLRILEAVTPAPKTAGQIAQTIGLSVERAWHHLRALVRAGVLLEAGEQPRAGRPQKLYAPSAAEFFVPASRRASTVGRELGRLLEFSLEHHDAALGEHLFHDGSRWRVQKVYAPETEISERQHDLWFITQLNPGERKALRDEMEALFAKYAGHASAGSTASIIRFACAPLPEDLPAALE